MNPNHIKNHDLQIGFTIHLVQASVMQVYTSWPKPLNPAIKHYAFPQSYFSRSLRKAASNSPRMEGPGGAEEGPLPALGGEGWHGRADF